ncbi:hypothetical protein [Streptomyces sp. MMBL 11-3]|uniref:hypothetical protein n=1 Tax=Streptomyces sp. MMBL 11-3 TaxID=3382639 RepID=UPI0039B418A4
MTDPNEADLLLRALWKRVDAGYTGDTEALLDPSAPAEADRLLQVSTTHEGASPVEAVHAVAVLRALRFLSGGDQEERLMALRLLTEVRLVEPELATQDMFAAIGAGPDDGLALLGADLLGRARTDPDPDVLQRAVSLLEEAVNVTPEESDHLAARLSNLGLAYRMRAERRGTDEFDQAVSAGERAVSACPPDSLDRVGCLANLADSLHARFERSSDLTDLERAVSAHATAVEAASSEHPLRGTALGKLGAALTARFVIGEHPDDIAAAVELCAQAAASVTPDDPFYAQHHTNLGMAHAVRATLANAQGDIESAVVACRKAVAATVPGDPSAVIRWQNLAAALHDRYELLGARDDLTGAAAAARQAVGCQEELVGDPWALAVLLSNASAVLRVRGDAEEDEEDLELAVDTARRAMELSGPGHPGLVDRAHNYATALLSRFDQRRRAQGDTGTADLDTAVCVLRGALGGAAVEGTRPTRHLGSLSTLGLILLRRFEHDGRTADLDDAIRICGEAVTSLPSRHPGLAGAALNLGSALRADTSEDSSGDRAVKAWQSGASATASPVALRLACARQWAEQEAERGSWESAVPGYAEASALLPLVAWHGLERSDQEYGLTRQATVARDAAAAALAARNTEHAFRSLEQGRAVLWNQHLRLHDDMDLLNIVAPGLAEGLQRVRAALDDVNFATVSMLRRV